MDALAGSPLSVVIFVGAALIVTRLFDAVLKDKMPKWLLPWVSMVIGMAGQVSTSLLAGQGWKQALLYGFASGAGGVWAYSAGAKKLPGIRAGGKEVPK